MTAILLVAAALSGSLSPSDDELFPGAGQVAATVATGVPYVAIGEVAYGVSDRFAVGAVGGVTPVTYGVGVRARGLLVEGDVARLVAGMPLLYYPATRSLGHEPWLLAMPQLLVERPLEGGGKLHAGAGVAAAACTGAVAGFFGGAHQHADGKDGFMGGIWNTVTVGGAMPLGSFRAFADATLILHGVRLAGDDWIGGPPVVITIGMRRGF